MFPTKASVKQYVHKLQPKVNLIEEPHIKKFKKFTATTMAREISEEMALHSNLKIQKGAKIADEISEVAAKRARTCNYTEGASEYYKNLDIINLTDEDDEESFVLNPTPFENNFSNEITKEIGHLNLNTKLSCVQRILNMAGNLNNELENPTPPFNTPESDDVFFTPEMVSPPRLLSPSKWRYDTPEQKQTRVLEVTGFCDNLEPCILQSDGGQPRIIECGSKVKNQNRGMSALRRRAKPIMEISRSNINTPRRCLSFKDKEENAPSKFNNDVYC